MSRWDERCSIDRQRVAALLGVDPAVAGTVRLASLSVMEQERVIALFESVLHTRFTAAVRNSFVDVDDLVFYAAASEQSLRG